VLLTSALVLSACATTSAMSHDASVRCRHSNAILPWEEVRTASQAEGRLSTRVCRLSPEKGALCDTSLLGSYR
jgi:hypothetical protein